MRSAHRPVASSEGGTKQVPLEPEQRQRVLQRKTPQHGDFRSVEVAHQWCYCTLARRKAPEPAGAIT